MCDSLQMAKKPNTEVTPSEGGNVSKPIKGYPTKVLKEVQLFVFALYQFANDGLVSGRTGGDVKMRNGRSRKMTVPALVRNAYTSVARGLLSTISANWNLLLTDNQRREWRGFSFQTANRFGVMKTYTGKLAYVRCNTLLVYSGQTPIVNPPASNTAPQSNILYSLDVDLTATKMWLDYFPIDTGSFVLVYASKPLNVGISRPSQSQLRLIGVIDTTVTGPADLWTEYTAKFGVPALGQRVFVQTKTVRDSAGIPSAITAIDGISHA